MAGELPWTESRCPTGRPFQISRSSSVNGPICANSSSFANIMLLPETFCLEDFHYYHNQGVSENVTGSRCRYCCTNAIKKKKMKTCLNEHRKEIEIKLVIFMEFLLWMALKTNFWRLRSNVVSNVAKNDKIKAFKFESKSPLVNMTCYHSDKIQVIIEIDLSRSSHFDLIDLRGSRTWTQNMTRLILIKNSTWDFVAVNWLVNDSTKILCRVHNSIATDLFFQWLQAYSAKHTRYSVHFAARAIKIFWIDNVRFVRVK